MLEFQQAFGMTAVGQDLEETISQGINRARFSVTLTIDNLLSDILVRGGETNEFLPFIRHSQAGSGNMCIAVGDFIENNLEIVFYDKLDGNPEVLGKGLNQVVFRTSGTMRPNILGGSGVTGQDTEFTAVLDLFEEVLLGRTGVEYKRQRRCDKHKN